MGMLSPCPAQVTIADLSGLFFLQVRRLLRSSAPPRVVPCMCPDPAFAAQLPVPCPALTPAAFHVCTVAARRLLTSLSHKPLLLFSNAGYWPDFGPGGLRRRTTPPLRRAPAPLAAARLQLSGSQPRPRRLPRWQPTPLLHSPLLHRCRRLTPLAPTWPIPPRLLWMCRELQCLLEYCIRLHRILCVHDFGIECGRLCGVHVSSAWGVASRHSCRDSPGLRVGLCVRWSAQCMGVLQHLHRPLALSLRACLRGLCDPCPHTSFGTGYSCIPP
jgi:hypothetical protein